MAATRASKLISCTDYVTGTVFYVSCNKIIQFMASVDDVTDTMLTYLSNKNTVTTRRITEAVATIATAMESNTVSQAIALTVNKVNGNSVESSVIYINTDRIIYLDSVGSDTQVTYDAGYTVPHTLNVTSPAIATISSTTSNMFSITTQETPGVGSFTRYINNLFIGAVTSESVSTDAVLAFTMKLDLVTNITVSAGGTGYVAGAYPVTGGGGTGGVVTITVDGGGAILTAIATTAGSGYTSMPTFTPPTGSGATFGAVQMALSAITITSGGSNYNTTPTLTFTGGTPATTATATATLTSGSITSTNITAIGAGYDSFPTLTVGGGTGAHIVYDDKSSEFKIIEVAETAAQVAAAVAAL